MPLLNGYKCFGTGKYGYLPSFSFDNKRSMFINIKDDTGNCFYYSLLCSLFGLDLAKSKGVDLYKTVEYPDEKMQTYLECADTWRTFAEDINRFKQPDLLIDWNESKLSKFEKLNNVRIFLRTHRYPNERHIKCNEVMFRTPHESIEEWAPEVNLFLLHKTSLHPSFSEFYKAEWHFIALLDDFRFNCASKLGCVYCNQKKPFGPYPDFSVETCYKSM